MNRPNLEAIRTELEGMTSPGYRPLLLLLAYITDLEQRLAQAETVLAENRLLHEALEMCARGMCCGDSTCPDHCRAIMGVEASRITAAEVKRVEVLEQRLAQAEKVIAAAKGHDHDRDMILNGEICPLCAALDAWEGKDA